MEQNNLTMKNMSQFYTYIISAASIENKHYKKPNQKQNKWMKWAKNGLKRLTGALFCRKNFSKQSQKVAADEQKLLWLSRN